MSFTAIVIKHIHVWFVLLSFTAFAVRFIWLVTHSDRLNARATKIIPHIIDTLLLLSGITLAILLNHSLLSISWFTLKLSLISNYILLGIITFKLNLSTNTRRILGMICIALFISIAYLAANRPPA